MPREAVWNGNCLHALQRQSDWEFEVEKGRTRGRRRKQVREVDAEVEPGLQYFRTYTNRSLMYLAITWKHISTNSVYLGCWHGTELYFLRIPAANRISGRTAGEYLNGHQARRQKGSRLLLPDSHNTNSFYLVFMPWCSWHIWNAISVRTKPTFGFTTVRGGR